jgi:hypothetical protein
MASGTRRNAVRVDEDGVKSVRTGRVRAHVWLLAAAIVVAGAALLGGLRLLLGGGTTGASEPAAEAEPQG